MHAASAAAQYPGEPTGQAPCGSRIGCAHEVLRYSEASSARSSSNPKGGADDAPAKADLRCKSVRPSMRQRPSTASMSHSVHGGLAAGWPRQGLYLENSSLMQGFVTSVCIGRGTGRCTSQGAGIRRSTPSAWRITPILPDPRGSSHHHVLACLRQVAVLRVVAELVARRALHPASTCPSALGTEISSLGKETGGRGSGGMAALGAHPPSRDESAMVRILQGSQPHPISECMHQQPAQAAWRAADGRAGPTLYISFLACTPMSLSRMQNSELSYLGAPYMRLPEPCCLGT